MTEGMTNEVPYPWRCECGLVNPAHGDICAQCGTEKGSGAERVGVEDIPRAQANAGQASRNAATTKATAERILPQRVVVVDFDMPLGSMVVLFIKIAIAMIPAAIVVGILYFFFDLILLGALRGI